MIIKKQIKAIGANGNKTLGQQILRKELPMFLVYNDELKRYYIKVESAKSRDDIMVLNYIMSQYLDTARTYPILFVRTGSYSNLDERYILTTVGDIVWNWENGKGLMLEYFVDRKKAIQESFDYNMRLVTEVSKRSKIPKDKIVVLDPTDEAASSSFDPLGNEECVQILKGMIKNGKANR